MPRLRRDVPCGLRGEALDTPWLGLAVVPTLRRLFALALVPVLLDTSRTGPV